MLTKNRKKPLSCVDYLMRKLEEQELHRPSYEQAIRLIKQNEWFHVRIEVQDRQAHVFLDKNEEPVQIVEDLMHDHKVGSVGVRSGGGRFANLKVTAR
jgi:hypothetical protein